MELKMTKKEAMKEIRKMRKTFENYCDECHANGKMGFEAMDKVIAEEVNKLVKKVYGLDNC